MKAAVALLVLALAGFLWWQHRDGAQKALPGYDEAVHTPSGPNPYLRAKVGGELTARDVELRLDDDARQWALAHIHPMHCVRDRKRKTVFICIDTVNHRKAAYTVDGSDVRKTVLPEAVAAP